MKKPWLSLLTCFIITLLFSCGPGKEKKIDDISDTGGLKPAETTKARQSNVFIVWHKVADFTKWIALYESYDSARLANGLHNYVIGRGTIDTNMVMVAVKADDTLKAKQFAASQGLHIAMQKGGVLGTPKVSFINVQALDASTNVSPTRVMVTHTVKDWDVWKKEFDSHKQARMDAGLTDRAVGYDIDNNRSVMIVCAVADVKKADSFFQSKDLKDKMAVAGVEGAPEIFYYTVTKKY